MQTEDAAPTVQFAPGLSSQQHTAAEPAVCMGAAGSMPQAALGPDYEEDMLADSDTTQAKQHQESAVQEQTCRNMHREAPYHNSTFCSCGWHFKPHYNLCQYCGDKKPDEMQYTWQAHHRPPPPQSQPQPQPKKKLKGTWGWNTRYDNG